MPKLLNTIEKAHIVSALSGQGTSEISLADKYEVEIEDIEDIMVDAGYERCKLCDRWYEAFETIDENDEPTYLCEKCR